MRTIGARAAGGRREPPQDAPVLTLVKAVVLSSAFTASDFRKQAKDSRHGSRQ